MPKHFFKKLSREFKIYVNSFIIYGKKGNGEKAVLIVVVVVVFHFSLLR